MPSTCLQSCSGHVNNFGKLVKGCVDVGCVDHSQKGTKLIFYCFAAHAERRQ